MDYCAAKGLIDSWIGSPLGWGVDYCPICDGRLTETATASGMDGCRRRLISGRKLVCWSCQAWYKEQVESER